jgi:hypothetical protein
MNAFKITTMVLALGIAAGIGCGSDSGGKTDAPVIVAGTGGSTRADAGGLGGSVGTGGATGALGTGGAMGSGGGGGLDAPLATGGNGGSLDGGPAPDAPLTGVDGNTAEAGTAAETAPVINMCTGLTAAACDQAIRNAPVDNTVVAQDVPVISNTSYPACSQ